MSRVVGSIIGLLVIVAVAACGGSSSSKPAARTAFADPATFTAVESCVQRAGFVVDHSSDKSLMFTAVRRDGFGVSVELDPTATEAQQAASSFSRNGPSEAIGNFVVSQPSHTRWVPADLAQVETCVRSSA